MPGGVPEIRPDPAGPPSMPCAAADGHHRPAWPYPRMLILPRWPRWWRRGLRTGRRSSSGWACRA